MKTMTCRQLGGACEQEFHAETFEEMAALSGEHGKEMAQKGEREHLKAMESIREVMKDPDAMSKWMEQKRREFEVLPANV